MHRISKRSWSEILDPGIGLTCKISAIKGVFSWFTESRDV